MNSKFQSYWTPSVLPVSQTETTKLEEKEEEEEEELVGGGGGLRRRLSNLSLKIQSSSSVVGSSSSSWSFRRSKSVPAAFGGDHDDQMSIIRKWWESGWGWILSRKPTFAVDLEMNHEETTALGCHNKGSWRHVLFKLRSELTRLLLLLRSDDHNVLPKTFRYDYHHHHHHGTNNNKTPTLA